MVATRTRSVPGQPNWVTSPPARRFRRLPQLRVVSKEPLEVIIVSDGLTELDTHFVDGRTVYCTGDVNTCPHPHATHGDRRYYAWLAVQLDERSDLHLLRLTGPAVEAEPALRSPGQSLRGLRLHVWRTKGWEGSEMRCYLLPEVALDCRLCEAPDMRSYVRHLIEADNRPAHRRETRIGLVEAGAIAKKEPKRVFTY